MSAQWLNYDRELSTDTVMQKLGVTLIEDFRSTYGTCFDHRAAMLQKGDMKSYRELEWPSRPESCPPYLYKWIYQLENFYKRYRFKHDALSDHDIHEATMKKFVDNQVRCAVPLKITPVVFKVLQRARRIIREILGDYNRDKHKMLCRHGKRACQGTPYRQSYLDTKLCDQPFTCSSEHLQFFAECCEDDHIMKEFYDVALKDNRIRLTESLEYTEVPKSWKIHRSMMPNTLLGAFYSAGLGEYFRLQLLNYGLDIRKLQKIHKKLAQRASRNGRKVTADLSMASDSLTLQLLRILLPIKWYRALVYGRARYVKVEKRQLLLSSVLTMGLGSTFPLQTLVFYALVKAMGELDGRQHDVSCYGDDLIYSRHLHKYVKHVFPCLHLNLNLDKTYAEGSFRESCGGDYYRGVDVRPYQFEGGCDTMVGPRKQEFLYRLYNGLRSRWEEVELPNTFLYLRMELLMHGKSILQVPPSYPDGAGVKVVRPVKDYWFEPVLWRKASDRPREEKNWNGQFVFVHLHEFSDKRVVQRVQLPYLWERLRSQTDRDLEPVQRARYMKSKRHTLYQLLEKFGLPMGDYYASWDSEPNDAPVLQWVKAQRNPRYIRSKLTGNAFRRLVAVVSKKGSTKIGVTEASLTSWC